MKITIKILTGIIILLSIGAGLAKVMQVPQEVEFLGGIGLSTIMIIAFGGFQIMGGIFSLLPKFKLSGLALVTFGFFISTILIFVSGDVKFGLVSLIPVILAVFLFINFKKHADH